VEIDEEVAYCDKSAYKNKFPTVFAVRMAIYYTLMGGREE